MQKQLWHAHVRRTWHACVCTYMHEYEHTRTDTSGLYISHMKLSAGQCINSSAETPAGGIPRTLHTKKLLAVKHACKVHSIYMVHMAEEAAG